MGLDLESSLSSPTLQLSTSPLIYRLKEPLVTAHGPHTERKGWLVTLTDEEGRVGHGEAMPLPAFGTESHEAAEASLRHVHRRFAEGPVILPELPEQLEEWLMGCEPTVTVRHALELAALELQALRARLPLSRWLWEAWVRDGGDASSGPRPVIEVNALLGAQDRELLAQQGLESVRAGARTVKVKVASGPVVADVLRLRRLREVLGEGVRIRIDANSGWRDRHQAREALLALSAEGDIELCEQPLPVGHVDGLKALRGRVPCLIAADESLGTVSQAAQLIASEAVDVLVLKPMVLGGLLPALRWARLGRAAGAMSVVTGSLDGVVARAGAAHLAAVVGGDRLAHGLWTGNLFMDEPSHPYVPERGNITLPVTPGLGLELQPQRELLRTSPFASSGGGRPRRQDDGP